MTAVLTGLPTEILKLIFSAFCLHCCSKDQLIASDAYLHGTQQHDDEQSWYSLERHALFSICLVSRRFRDIAQDILYHEFILGYGDSWRSNLYTWKGRLTSFMRTVAQRRDLATHVKRIYVHPYLLEPLGNEETWDALEQAAHALEIKSWRKLSSSQLVTILIAELPNLEHFSLQVATFPSDGVRSSGLRAAGVSKLPLRTIDISLYATPSQARWNLFTLDECMCDILELASDLETLNLHMCDGLWRPGQIPSLPKLKTLCITHSRLSEKNIEALISSCSGLRTFVYETIKPTWEGRSVITSREHFRPSNAVRYLSPHCKTLNSLHLDLRARCAHFTGSREQPIFSLKDFAALEHLFLNSSEIYSSLWNESPADNQLLVQLLPTGIKSLHLAGNIGDALPRLANGLLGLSSAVLQGQFPSLEQVRCDVQQRIDIKYAVDATFAAAGIDFSYDSWPLSKATLLEGEGLPLSHFHRTAPLSDSDSDSDYL